MPPAGRDHPPSRTRSVNRLPTTNGTPFAEVAACYQDIVDRTCRDRLGDGPDAEDARQQGALRLLGRGVRDDAARSWQRLSRRASYELLEERQAAEDHSVPVGDPRVASALALDPEDVVLSAVAAAEDLAQLTELQRDAVLARWAGFSLSEAAWQRRISVGAFATRLREAKRRLRELGVGAGLGLAWLARRLRERARSLDRALVPLRLFLARVGALFNLDVSTLPWVAPIAIAILMAGSGAPAVLTPTQGPLAASPAQQFTTPDLSLPIASASRSPRPLIDRLPGGVGHVRTPLLGDRGGESVDDTALVALAAAPDFQHHPQLVGLGLGGSCNCYVVWRSTDGGATWPDNYDGPRYPAAGPTPSLVTIALPPAFPLDPRIFIGFPDQPGNTDYSTPAFGTPFAPLPTPPGAVAVSAGFDNGDPRVFVASANGVLALNIATNVIAPLTVASDGATASLLATPYGDPTTAVVILTQRAVLLPPTTLTPGPGLVVCDFHGGCAARPSRHLIAPTFAAFALVRQPDGFAAAVASYTQVAISSDEGTSFAAGPPIASSVTTFSVSLSSAQDVWIGTSSHSPSRVLHLDRSGMWEDVTPSALRAGTSPVLLLTPRPGLALAALVNTSILCTADGGASWHPRCVTPATP